MPNKNNYRDNNQFAFDKQYIYLDACQGRKGKVPRCYGSFRLRYY